MKQKNNIEFHTKRRFILFDLDGWQEIWNTISQNKMRSLFTAFGVFWGIFMLVVMVGLGTGIKNSTFEMVKHVSANSAFMFANQTSEPYKGFQRNRQWTLNTDDALALRREFPDITKMTILIFSQSDNTNNTVRADKYGSFQVLGVSPDMNKIAPSRILQGRYLNDIDMREGRKVVVVGTKVVNDLFAPGENPIGSLIRVNGIYYSIIGVQTPYNENFQFFGRADEQIQMPASTLQRAMNMGHDIHGLGFTLNDKTNIEPVEEQIHQFIKQRHSISPTDDQALQGVNLKKMFSTFQVLILGINILIWIVGLGTLLAGLVGISNIMLVTVRERTQEIGVRRALGATPHNIMVQVLCESLVLTLLAGIVGLCFGIGILALVGQVVPMEPGQSLLLDPQITFTTAIVALMVLVVSGLLAGALPANRALHIKAIEALRDE